MLRKLRPTAEQLAELARDKEALSELLVRHGFSGEETGYLRGAIQVSRLSVAADPELEREVLATLPPTRSVKAEAWRAREMLGVVRDALEVYQEERRRPRPTEDPEELAVALERLGAWRRRNLVPEVLAFRRVRALIEHVAPHLLDLLLPALGRSVRPDTLRSLGIVHRGRPRADAEWILLDALVTAARRAAPRRPLRFHNRFHRGGDDNAGSGWTAEFVTACICLLPEPDRPTWDELSWTLRGVVEHHRRHAQRRRR